MVVQALGVGESPSRVDQTGGLEEEGRAQSQKRSLPHESQKLKGAVIADKSNGLVKMSGSSSNGGASQI